MTIPELLIDFKINRKNFKFLEEGTNGKAFEILFGVHKNKVLKQTTSALEFKFAKKILTKYNNYEHFVKIYNVQKTNKYYYILMDKVEINFKKTELIIDKFEKYTGIKLEDILEYPENNQPEIEYLDDLIPEFVGFENNGNFYEKYFLQLYTLIMDLVEIKAQDLHFENLGFKDGKLIMFDIQ